MHRTSTGQAPADPPLPASAEALLPLVYTELRRLAARRMAGEAQGQTLQATALVHEAWLRLGREHKDAWASKAQFFSAAAEAMRRILIDQARMRAAAKRGGAAAHETLHESQIETRVADEEILAVHEALEQLAAEDPQAADLVKLRFFTGMTMAEAADAMGLPLRTVERTWTFCRARLRGLISEPGG
jgi:RNA polymerase sigma factor (TIGR02999 family)